METAVKCSEEMPEGAGSGRPASGVSGPRFAGTIIWLGVTIHSPAEKTRFWEQWHALSHMTWILRKMLKDRRRVLIAKEGMA